MVLISLSVLYFFCTVLLYCTICNLFNLFNLNNLFNLFNLTIPYFLDRYTGAFCTRLNRLHFCSRYLFPL